MKRKMVKGMTIKMFPPPQLSMSKEKSRNDYKKRAAQSKEILRQENQLPGDTTTSGGRQQA